MIKARKKTNSNIKIEYLSSEVLSPDIKKALSLVLSAACNRLIPNTQSMVELMICSKEQIRELNSLKRGKDSVTDVLSFPSMNLFHADLSKVVTSGDDYTDNRLFLGSIVICYDVALAQSQEYNHSLLREICFLAVHSLLHLLGWDHEQNKQEEAEQFSLQEMILKSCGISR